MTSLSSHGQAYPALDYRYRDAALPVETRLDILIGQMTLEEKAGQFFHAMVRVGEGGTLAGAEPEFEILPTREMVTEAQISHFNVFGRVDDATEFARWNNAMQDVAASTRLGIPVTLSTDPRHSFTDNAGTGLPAGAFSEWPEPLGLAATRSAELVERFAGIARQEYLAVGLRVALHPQIDLATEPRWSRQLATFGEDAELTAELAVAYVCGFQGESFGATSVSTMTKHFPGGGPQKDGEDPHFAYGREQVYPGGRFEHHLKPFEAVIAAGTRQIMPYYGMPVGTELEEVGFGFNKGVVTGLLRERFGFDGIVCADWGLITDHVLAGAPFPARAWGVEHLTPLERMRKILDAGVDQFGGEACPELLVELVRSGQVTERRVDESVRRLLREKFVLGLFDSPYVDEHRAGEVVGSPENRRAGLDAQRASITLVTNDGLVPLGAGLRIYAEGIDAAVVAEYGIPADSPRKADVAVLRIEAPFRAAGNGFEAAFHSGSLDFSAAVVDHITEVAVQVPTIVDVFLDRPAILSPFIGSVAAVTANFGADPRALLDVLFGRYRPGGRLPFDLPSSMAAVEASRPDVPFDTVGPLFRFGHGLTYETEVTAG